MKEIFLCLQAINALRIESQINLSRTLLEERAQKDIAIQQALAQARADKQPAEPFSGLLTDGKHAYNVAWITQSDGTQQGATVLPAGAFLTTDDVVQIDEAEKEKG